MEWYWWLGGICGAFVLLIVVALGYFMVTDSSKRRRTVRDGQHVTAWIVQANMRLYQDSILDDPALVVISPDAETADDKDFMIALADRIMDLKDTDPDNCDNREDAFVAELMFDEAYVEGKRVALPRRFAGGRDVYLAHVFVYREDLPGKKLRRRRLTCAIIWEDPKSLICTCPPNTPTFREDEDDD